MRKWSIALLLVAVVFAGACQKESAPVKTGPGITSGTTPLPSATPTVPESTRIKETSPASTSPSPSAVRVILEEWAGKWVLHTDDGDSLLTLSPERNQPGHLFFQLFEPRMKEDRLKPYEYSGVFAVEFGAESESGTFEDSPLTLRFKRNKDRLDLSAVGFKEYFGSHTVLGGRYTKYMDSKEQAVTDNQIMPGVSVGKVKIGMTQEDVKRKLGNPVKEDGDAWTYTSTDGKRFIEVRFDDRRVVQIDFNSPTFMTEDLMGIGTFEQPLLNEGKFKLYKFQWRFIQLRYDYNKPGLSFYSFNTDSDGSEGNPAPNKMGSVYSGNTPHSQPIEGANWEVWDGRF